MAKQKAVKKTSSPKRRAKAGALTAISPNRVEGMIMLLRGERVILDSDLAGLYGVETKVLNQAVKRNIERFPDDFMFQLTWDEAKDLKSQSVTLNSQDGSAASRSQSVTLKRGKNIKYRPHAFTEHGAIMAATVLNSPRAVQVSVYVVRAFVRLRRMMLQHKDLASKLDKLEHKLKGDQSPPFHLLYCSPALLLCA